MGLGFLGMTKCTFIITSFNVCILGYFGEEKKLRNSIDEVQRPSELHPTGTLELVPKVEYVVPTGIKLLSHVALSSSVTAYP